MKELFKKYAGEKILEVKKQLARTGLLGSRLYNSLSYTSTEDSITFHIPYYAVYVDKGRAQGKRLPPKEPILEWMQLKHIPSYLEFPIRKSIAKNGIAPRPFLHIFKENEELANRLGKQIVTEVIDDINDLKNRNSW